MCDAPTWGPEVREGSPDAPTLAALQAAGWSNAELIWEQIQEAAAESAGQTSGHEAAALWQGALEVARSHFAADDARLATSLASLAFARRNAADARGARVLLDEALDVWRASKSWFERLKPEVTARSSTFHLRLQAKHPGAYAGACARRYLALAEEGRAAIAASRDGAGCVPLPPLRRWRRERPEGFDDMRKALAAVLLMPGPSDE